MSKKKIGWLFRYHGFQNSEGSTQLFAWLIIFMIGITSFIWLAKLYHWLKENIWTPIDSKLTESFGEDWGVISLMIGFLVVLPLGINLNRHGFNFKKWT